MSELSGEQISFRQGGGIFVLRGIMLACGAVGFVFIDLMARPVDGGGEAWPEWIPIGFGALGVLLGLYMALARDGQIIDRAKREVERWDGLPWPIVRKRYALGAPKWVYIGRALRAGGDGTKQAYPVSLKLPDKAVEFGAPFTVSKAYAIARQIAEFLNLGIRDGSSGAEIEVPADLVGQPLRDRLQHSAETWRQPIPPIDLNIDVEHMHGATSYSQPVRGWRSHRARMRARMGVLLVLFGVLATIGQLISLELKIDNIWKGVFIAFFFSFVVGMPVIAFVVQSFVLARLCERVDVTHDTMRIHTDRFVGTRDVTIPLDELQGLHVWTNMSGKEKAILAWSERVDCQFGRDLNDDERAWLVEALRHVIAGGR